ncbi:MAG: serine/threonine protein kinase, partial [Actinobacteria bacterium]
MQETTHVLADRYELGRVLGEGGMARVYRGVDRQLRRPVAVK